MPALRTIAAAAAAAVACGPRPAPPIVDPPDGLAVAVYLGAGQAYVAVDDRRTIEVTGRRVLLDRVLPDAALPTLVIEPLGAARGALAIAQCARERLRPEPAGAPGPAGPGGGDAEDVISPLVACTVTGPPGRHRVRVHHVAASRGWEARHEISMTAPDRATISTRLTVPTPALRARGELVLHDGVPGAGDPPREVGRGVVTFDGGIAVIAPPPREVPARLVRVFDGMVRSAAEPTAAAWGKESHHRVRVLLDLGGARLLRGKAHVRISIGGGDTSELGTVYDPDDRELAAPALEEGTMGRRASSARTAATARAAAAARAAPASRDPGPARLLLWTDPLLRGTRKRVLERADERSLVDRLELTVSNTGGEPREVWIEEPLRTARRRELARIPAGSPRPELVGDVARAKVVVGPGETARVGFTVRYTF